MIREQRWTPDTCANYAAGDACVIIETWDDTTDPAARTYTYVRHEKTCSFHASAFTANPNAAFNRLYDENKRKNQSFAAMQSVKVTALEQFKWSYDADGVLTIDTSAAGLNTQQRNALINVCNTQFGPGKVVVV